MALALHATEEGQGPPLLILHGLFGSGRNWARIAKALAGSHRVVLLDLRNHGASPWEGGMSYAEMAQDVIAFLAARGLAVATQLGHSMGGKVGMVTALLHGGAVDRLVVVDVAPVPYPPNLLGHVRAMRAVDLSGITRRSEVDAALVGAVPDRDERAFLLLNLLFENGRPRWRLNLEAIEAGMGEIGGFPVMPPCARFAKPTLFVLGGRSTYFRPEHEALARSLFPAMRIARIAGAGHWVHSERPAEFLDEVRRFLEAG